MRACLFNIQRYSLHDGDGIRTMVFFKGCPLRCLWCSNPESIRPEPDVMRSPDKRDPSVAGKMYELEEVVRECLRDRDFYEESGGGVTLSGGEVTAQADFAEALLRRLREEGVRTAIETNGFADRETFMRVAGETDLVLFDVKQHDSAKHIEGTGADNRLILENLRRLVDSGAAFLVRIPVIRGFSDSLEDAARFAGLLVSLGVHRTQLLPFHQMGQSKFAMIGMEYTLADRPPMHREELEPFRQAMLASGMREVIL